MDLDMSPYGVFVWSSFGLSLILLTALASRTLWQARRTARDLAELEARSPPAPDAED